jgi:hypothetical protein
MQKLTNDPAERKPPRFVKLDKNLCNYPIARDARLRPRWRKSGSYLLTELAGEERIELQLPANVPAGLKRFPTAFDFNVLMVLLRQAQVERTNKIQFRSYNRILKAMRLPPQSRERAKVRSALRLWSVLGFNFRQWWDASPAFKDEGGVPSWHDHRARGLPGKNRWQKRAILKQLPPPRMRGSVRRSLPPPIEMLDGLRMRIAAAWLPKVYFERMVLPLPQRAAAQNLVLWLIGGSKWSERLEKYDMTKYKFDDDDPEVSRYQLRLLYKKTALRHSNRTVALQRAMKEAEAWFDVHGGHLGWMDRECWPEADNTVIFFVWRPKTKLEPEPEPEEQFEEQQPEEQQEPPETRDPSPKTRAAKEWERSEPGEFVYEPEPPNEISDFELEQEEFVERHNARRREQGDFD